MTEEEQMAFKKLEMRVSNLEGMLLSLLASLSWERERNPAISMRSAFYEKSSSLGGFKHEGLQGAADAELH